jgi:mono/diheme cytochrome c family protein
MKPSALLIAAFAFGLASCNQDMDNQPKYNEYKPATLFPSGGVLQHAPAGTVSREAYAREASAPEKPPLTRALLDRGRERYDIFCSPCHAKTGDGYGRIVARGLPHPQSLDSEAMRNASDDHFYGVITNGYGMMYPLGYKIEPQDRWAIVAYLRALQLSQRASASDLTPEMRGKLGAKP